MHTDRKNRATGDFFRNPDPAVNPKKLRPRIYMANDLIEARKDINFTTVGSRIFYLALQALNPHISDNDKHFDRDFPVQFIPCNKLVKLFGNTAYLTSIRNACEYLKEATIQFTPKARGILIDRVFRVLEYVPYEGLYMQLDDTLRYYLLDLRNTRYTRMKPQHLFPLTSPRAMRLLELLLQYQNIAPMKSSKLVVRTLTLDEIRFAFDIEFHAYRNRPDTFFAGTLQRPMFEINSQTPYRISCKPVKSGRRIIAFQFFLDMKNTQTFEEEEAAKADAERNTFIFDTGIDPDPIKKLVAFGFEYGAAYDILKRCDSVDDCNVRIERAVASINAARKRRKIRNPLGYLREHITTDGKFNNPKRDPRSSSKAPAKSKGALDPNNPKKTRRKGHPFISSTKSERIIDDFMHTLANGTAPDAKPGAAPEATPRYKRAGVPLPPKPPLSTVRQMEEILKVVVDTPIYAERLLEKLHQKGDTANIAMIETAIKAHHVGGVGLDEVVHASLHGELDKLNTALDGKSTLPAAVILAKAAQESKAAVLAAQNAATNTTTATATTDTAAATTTDTTAATTTAATDATTTNAPDADAADTDDGPDIDIDSMRLSFDQPNIDSLKAAFAKNMTEEERAHVEKCTAKIGTSAAAAALNALKRMQQEKAQHDRAAAAAETLIESEKAYQAKQAAKAAAEAAKDPRDPINIITNRGVRERLSKYTPEQRKNPTSSMLQDIFGKRANSIVDGDILVETPPDTPENRAKFDGSGNTMTYDELKKFNLEFGVLPGNKRLLNAQDGCRYLRRLNEVQEARRQARIATGVMPEMLIAIIAGCISRGDQADFVKKRLDEYKMTREDFIKKHMS